METQEKLEINNQEKSKKLNKSKGQSLVEYGLILALVSVVAIAILSTLGTNINDTIDAINTTLEDVNTNIGTAPP